MVIRWKLNDGKQVERMGDVADAVADPAVVSNNQLISLPPIESPQELHDFLRAVMAPAIARALMEGCDLPSSSEKE